MIAAIGGERDETVALVASSVEIVAIVSRDATAVEVTYKDVSASGVSKRNTGEVFSAEVGFELALARALPELAQRIAEKHGYQFGGE